MYATHQIQICRVITVQCSECHAGNPHLCREHTQALSKIPKGGVGPHPVVSSWTKKLWQRRTFQLSCLTKCVFQQRVRAVWRTSTLCRLFKTEAHLGFLACQKPWQPIKIPVVYFCILKKVTWTNQRHAVKVNSDTSCPSNSIQLMS